VALNAFEHNGARIRLACAVLGIIETCCRYRPKLCDDNAQIADWLVRLTHSQKNWGLGSVTYFYAM